LAIIVILEKTLIRFPLPHLAASLQKAPQDSTIFRNFRPFRISLPEGLANRIPVDERSTRPQRRRHQSLVIGSGGKKPTLHQLNRIKGELWNLEWSIPATDIARGRQARQGHVRKKWSTLLLSNQPLCEATMQLLESITGGTLRRHGPHLTTIGKSTDPIRRPADRLDRCCGPLHRLLDLRLHRAPGRRQGDLHLDPMMFRHESVWREIFLRPQRFEQFTGTHPIGMKGAEESHSTTSLTMLSIDRTAFQSELLIKV